MKGKRVAHAFGFICILGVFVGCDSTTEDVTPENVEKTQSLDSSAQKVEMSEDSITQPGKPNETAVIPKIELESPEIDFGLIPSDSSSSKEMKIVNRGDAPLVITKVTTSCGCTQGKMKENTILPGQEGVLEITVDPNRINGFNSRKILSIASNDPVQSIIQLPVSAQLKGEVKLSENSFIFESVSKEDTVEKRIRLTHTDSNSVALVKVGLSPETPKEITLKHSELPQSEWKNANLPEQELVLSLSPGLPSGSHKYSVELLWDRAKNPTQSIPIHASVIGPYQFSPDAITLRNVTTGQISEGVMHLNYTIPVEILSLSIDNENIHITHRAGEKPNSIAFDLLIAKPQKDRLQKGDLSITLSVDGEEVVHTIRVIGLMERVPTSKSDSGFSTTKKEE